MLLVWALAGCVISTFCILFCGSIKLNFTAFSGKNIQHQENFLLPEFEIVTEPEENTDETESDHSCVTNFEVQSDGLDTELDTEGTFAEVADKQFQKFKEIINRDPEQVRLDFRITKAGLCLLQMLSFLKIY